MVIDGHVVIAGSFNFTKAAEENNAENLRVIDDAELSQKYAKNWQDQLAHSALYEGTAARPQTGSANEERKTACSPSWRA